MKEYRFSLEDIANLICEYTKDGKRKRNRDVVKWFRWAESRYRPGQPSHIITGNIRIRIVRPKAAGLDTEEKHVRE